MKFLGRAAEAVVPGKGFHRFPQLARPITPPGSLTAEAAASAVSPGPGRTEADGKPQEGACIAGFVGASIPASEAFLSELQSNLPLPALSWSSGGIGPTSGSTGARLVRPRGPLEGVAETAVLLSAGSRAVAAPSAHIGGCLKQLQRLGWLRHLCRPAGRPATGVPTAGGRWHSAPCVCTEGTRGPPGPGGSWGFGPRWRVRMSLSLLWEGAL